MPSSPVEPDFETGVIYREDNLLRLSLLPPECVDLIYLDPPFFSNRQYEVIWGDEAEVRSFEDRWAGGLRVYVDWMQQRLVEMRRVLAPTGSIYLHCDPHASHYLKVMMDEVFGPASFRNEVIWKRTSAHSSAKRFGPIHDTLLYYGKTESVAWNDLRTDYEPAYLDRYYRFDDGDGRLYWRADLCAAGVRHGRSGAPWRGLDVASKGMHWKFTVERLDELNAEGRIYWPTRGTRWPQYKRYRDELKGKPLGDIWDDIDRINPVGRERIGYPTQKPEALLERIIKSSSNEGDVILDPFCGCGTSLVVAHLQKRRWIGIDISTTACNMMDRRLRKIGAEPKLRKMPQTEEQLLTLKPFEFQNWIIDRILGIQANRKSGDMGIDGWTFLLKEPVQIKQNRAGRGVIDSFETALQRSGRKRGFVIAVGFTPGTRDEIVRARKQQGLDIHLLTVRDLLERPEWVMAQMGVAGPQVNIAAMPQFDSRRHTAEELIASAAAS